MDIAPQALRLRLPNPSTFGNKLPVYMHMQWERFSEEASYDQNMYYIVYSDNSITIQKGTSKIKSKNLAYEGDVYIALVTIPQVHTWPFVTGC